ncbi:hypothetical protein MMC24_000368 [Lignoscripta atroalba]|nr:hypothetical protein [Lignoscripta atroalba]
MPPLRPLHVLLRHLPNPSLSSATTPSILSVSLHAPTASTSSSSSQPIQHRSHQFSTSSSYRAGPAADAHHEDHYDPPSGWLFGVPPGEKYKKEGWENIWVYGFFGSLLMAVVAYAYKPDSSIQTWALEEARRRLEAEGILPDPSSEKK